MINAKSESTSYKLVEQVDIKETVLLDSKTNVGYKHNVTLSDDPSKFDYLIILVTSNSDYNKICYAKKHGDAWFTNSSPTDYRHISISIESQSGTSMKIDTTEWESKSTNYGCSINSIIGVNRGGSLTLNDIVEIVKKAVVSC